MNHVKLNSWRDYIAKRVIDKDLSNSIINNAITLIISWNIPYCNVVTH